MWPEEGVEALELAREMVQQGRAVGLEAALRGEEAPVGVEDRTPATKPPAGDIAALAGASLVEELRALREAVEEQNRLLREQGERLEALERDNRELRAALPAVPSEAIPSEVLQGEVPHGGIGPEKPEPVKAPAGDRPDPGLWQRVREWLRGRDT